ncbi:ABC transporter ATP-binding protein [Legionella spiritensis]|uniref:ABC transporter of LPS O-antigen n=1 Tax=Legionella spiritensis TaxID=452 RepID=A0A0W0YYN5_LEGSP|nr:ABC transporter ATP-binding protein [Legionella spiritensis]KTD61993.1 ABC transporter of LPS O-antigen [Legionella spiritensis]SNV34908.1 ABC transporter of LPS O-antigen [Legionella spiritensis]
MNRIGRDIALSCEDLSKEFYIIDDQLNWRIIFRDKMKQFNSFKALHNISLDIPKGKFVGILGRNGAGKSTLLRVLGGVYAPTTGVVKVSGDVSSLFEMGGLGNNQLTGYSYASRFLEIYGIDKTRRQTLIENIKEFSELGDDFHNPMYSYSSGMCARLFFATSTELQHEIYLVDELLSVGDEHFQAKCWKRLRERFTNGASGILVTHDWTAVLKLCETSYILDKGHVISSGPSENIVQQYLNLPVPTKEYAEIISNPNGYTMESGEDCEIKFAIDLKKPVPLAVNYSIELFRSGYGWELILLNENYVTLDCHPGLNHVIITIKKLPLVTGDYYLNLFLKSLDSNVDSLQLDGRSWTYGNGIKIQVKGEPSRAMIKLPWREDVKRPSHANA